MDAYITYKYAGLFIFALLLSVLLNTIFLKFSRNLGNRHQNGNLIRWSETTGKMTREDLKLFLEYGLHLFRESLIKNYAPPELSDLDENEDHFLLNFAPFIHEANCMYFTQEFERAIQEINRNANAKILLFDLSIKVMQFIRMKPEAQE